MNQTVSTLIAGAALALSALAIWKSERATGAPVATAAAVGVPAYEPAVVGPCEGEGEVADLDDVMRDRINPAMTRISFALFHDRGDPAKRMEAVSGWAGKLLGCVQLAAAYQPEAGVQGMSHYYALLAGLQTDTVAVQVAAMEMDEDAARHWFLHVKNDCAACHAQFRPASDDPAAP